MKQKIDISCSILFKCIVSRFYRIWNLSLCLGRNLKLWSEIWFCSRDFSEMNSFKSLQYLDSKTVFSKGTASYGAIIHISCPISLERTVFSMWTLKLSFYAIWSFSPKVDSFCPFKLKIFSRHLSMSNLKLCFRDNIKLASKNRQVSTVSLFTECLI